MNDQTDLPNPQEGPQESMLEHGMKPRCRECGAELQRPISQKGGRPPSSFCKDECRREFWRKAKLTVQGVNRQTVTAIHEMLATADLLKRGFQVYRAMSPDCECGLVALRAGRCYRVATRSGYMAENGHGVPTSRPADGTFDILAIATNVGLFYSPPLESLDALQPN